MIEKQIIFGDRRSGKTYRMMTEIYDLVSAGHRNEILIIFPAMSYLHYWQREWERRFPFVPMIRYTSLNAMDRVRGMYVKHVFIEDINFEQDGINSEQLRWLYPCFRGDGTITFTASPTTLSLRSHNKTQATLKAQIRLEAYQKMHRKKELEDDIITMVLTHRAQQR